MIFLSIGAFFVWKKKHSNIPAKVAVAKHPIVIPTPAPADTFKYVLPKIEKKREYQIVVLGDSMTYALGPHGGTFYEYINAHYKKDNHGITVDNYSQPSTSILTIHESMNREQKYWDVTLPPLMSRKFDLILIESFGYNPLSQFPRSEGLKKQTEILDQTVKDLMKDRPSSVIMFVATIAPSKATYAKSILTHLNDSDRQVQVEERSAFILNHIKYAKDHNIPLINIFEKSMTPSGDGNIEYINPDDDIHPSAVGLIFIGHQLADFIYASNIFPK